ncbi:MAG TPA: hypothetical protein VE956_10755 [Nodularia sp. (in: cyanobacteria)]|nr:hypothetical protein [Nodularia sp. (in: cyanobacteria)]
MLTINSPSALFTHIENFSGKAIAHRCMFSRFLLAIDYAMLLMLVYFAIEEQKLPRRVEMLNAILLAFFNLDDDMT